MAIWRRSPRQLGVPVERGPHDLRRLGEFFGQAAAAAGRLRPYDIEILAEINHAPRLSLADDSRAGRRISQPPAPT